MGGMDVGGAGDLKSRRDEYSEASRRALIASARKHFATHGFAGASLDAIAADARLTKGAVYHHFGNKQALFAAVLDEVEAETCAAVLEAASTAASVWEGGVAGLDTFLDRCLDKEIGLIAGLVRAFQDAGLIELADGETLTQILFGSVCACALAIARADDPKEVRDRMRQVLIRIIEGLAPLGPDAQRPSNHLSV
jgi:AcrR family transcriptional regulator